MSSISGTSVTYAGGGGGGGSTGGAGGIGGGGHGGVNGPANGAPNTGGGGGGGANQQDGGAGGSGIVIIRYLAGVSQPPPPPASTTLVSGMTYNAAGEITANTLGNGVTQSFTYNNRLQQTGITASLSGTTLMNFTYDYGTSSTNTGRVLARTDAIQSEHSARYFYDSIYRLGQVASNDASNSWGIGWTFDVWGNRVSQIPQGLATSKVGTQTIGYTNNRNTSNTYDAAGNQTNDGLHNYTFNAENQITQMDAGTAVYGYDGEGRRMKKTVGSETTYSFYGVGGLLCEFTTTNTGATAAASTDKALYRTSDKLGSAVLVLTASGTVIENNRTLPYGEAWLTETASTNDKKFTTYQRDQESGLDYALNRFFSNGNGRFVSVDKGSAKLYKPVTLNRYLYSVADPINYTDPDGNDPIPYICEVDPYDPGCALFHLSMGPGPEQESTAFPNAPRSLEALISDSRMRVKTMLGNPDSDCANAIGAKNSKSAVNRASSISIGSKNLGVVRGITDPSGNWVRMDPKSPALANESHIPKVGLFRSITFNSGINWQDPSNSQGMNQFGQLLPYDALAAMAAQVGASSLTNEQYMDLIMLHELAHSFGVDEGRNGLTIEAKDTNIWKNCFK